MNKRNDVIVRGSDDTFELAQAIFHAGRAGDESMVEAIANYLDHDNYRVRGAAIQALVFSMQKGEYFEHALRMLQDPDHLVRGRAISSVGNLAKKRPEDHERAVPVLVQAVRAAPSNLEAHHAYDWLNELGLVAFRVWDEEPPSEVLAAIEAAMGKLPDPG